MSVLVVEQSAGKIHVTDTLPPYCASCFAQQPDLVHVDFSADCDRGYGMDGAVRVTMDHLVLCANCVQAGGEQIGMRMPSEDDRAAQELQARLEEAERRALEAEHYAARLEDTISVRPERVRRPPGRPRKHVEDTQ